MSGMSERESLIVECFREIVEAARPAISSMPADCTNNCGMGPCDCSGVGRVLGWIIDVPRLRELLKEAPPELVVGKHPRKRGGEKPRHD